MREGERARESPRESQPLPGQAFIAFLGTSYQGWSSFTMHRFTVGDYLLQTTKDRILLIIAKRRMLQIKGQSGQTGYTPYLGGLAQTLESQRYSVLVPSTFAYRKHTKKSNHLQTWTIYFNEDRMTQKAELRY